MQPSDLRDARERELLTQAKAAEAVGVSLSTWRFWEYGMRRPLKFYRQALFARFPELEELYEAHGFTGRWKEKPRTKRA